MGGVFVSPAKWAELGPRAFVLNVTESLKKCLQRSKTQPSVGGIGWSQGPVPLGDSRILDSNTQGPSLKQVLVRLKGPLPASTGPGQSRGLGVVRPHTLDGPSMPPAHPGDTCILGNSSAPSRKPEPPTGANTHLLVLRGAVFQGDDRRTTLVRPDWGPRSSSLTSTGLQDIA